MITFETKYLRYSIDEAGNNVEFTDKTSGRNLLKAGHNPCGRIVYGHFMQDEAERTIVYPTAAAYTEPYLTLTYPDNITVRVLVGVHENYLTFALKSISTQNIWSVTAILCEVDIDYKADSSFVATLMGMSINTRMREYPGRNSVLMGEAYTHIALPGVKAAVIGAPEHVLNSIMREVLDEIPDGVVPKAAYSGPYACECPDAKRTYTIKGGGLTADAVDTYIEKLKNFGITQVHIHQGASYTQGDFSVNKDYYPDGIDGFKAIINKFHENGVQCMLHSYAFFVQHTKSKVGNKYLAPIPHKDLGVCRRYTLSADIAADTEYIPICEDTSDISTNFGYTIPESDLLWIDNEIIRFAGVDENGFTQIERGTFGSTVSEHKSGAQVKQLNSYFGYIAPTKGSELFYEIARNTAEFYNECDFDGYYLDAIDGVFVLDSNEFAWYHAVEFINELFKYQKKPPIFNCCYGPQYPGQWYARTRMGAFDAAYRGFRDFTDVHVDFNEKFAERMYLIGELGWWQLSPGFNDKLGWANKLMFDEDIDYICTKMLATNVCHCWHSSFESCDVIPRLNYYADRIRLYTKLKEENYFSQEIKDIVRKPYSEYELIELSDGEYRFRPTFTDFNKAESFDDGRNVFKINNRYAAQSPKLRIEPMLSADNYDCEDGATICEFDENVPVELDKPIALPNVNTDGKRGIGVWIKGDGKGEVINLRLQSPMHIARGNSDHFVKVDFTGWRYYAFCEFENCEMKHEDWAPQGLHYRVFTDVEFFYAAYTSPVDYSNLDTLTVMVNNPGDYDIRLKTVRSLPEHEMVLTNPTVKCGDKAITFKTDLKSKTFLEYDPESGKAVVYDYNGNLLCEPEVIGENIILESGDNTVELTAKCDSPYQKRAALTIRTFGEPI